MDEVERLIDRMRQDSEAYRIAANEHEGRLYEILSVAAAHLHSQRTALEYWYYRESDDE